jgi:hypothetical protein
MFFGQELHNFLKYWIKIVQRPDINSVNEIGTSPRVHHGIAQSAEPVTVELDIRQRICG